MFNKKVNAQQAALFAALGVIASVVLPPAVNPASMLRAQLDKLKGGVK